MVMTHFNFVSMQSASVTAGHSHQVSAAGQVGRRQQSHPPAGFHSPGSGGTPLNGCGQLCFSSQGILAFHDIISHVL